MRARRYRPPRPSLYARRGQHLEVQTLLGSRSYEPLARRQRPHREVGSEGSPRQSSEPRHTNRIRGWAARMSRQRTVTSATTKRLSDKCGGAGAKAAALIRGDLVGSGRVKRDASPKTVGPSHVGPPAWWPTLRVNSAPGQMLGQRRRLETSRRAAVAVGRCRTSRRSMRVRRANRNGRGTLLSAEFRPSRKTDPERHYPLLLCQAAARATLSAAARAASSACSRRNTSSLSRRRRARMASVFVSPAAMRLATYVCPRLGHRS